MLDKNNRLPYNYQSKIGYDILIQTVIIKEKITLMGATMVDIEFKLKIIISKYLESRLLQFLCIYINGDYKRCFQFW